MMNSIRPLAVSLAAAVIALSGCNRGHGTWTEGAKIQSQHRVDQLKSANEYQMAKQNFLAGDLDKALKGVEKSLTINPSVAISHVLRGWILIEMDNLEEASLALTRAETLALTLATELYHDVEVTDENGEVFSWKRTDPSSAEDGYTNRTTDV